MKTSSTDLIITEILSHQNSHLTSLQIYEEVHKRLPAINPSTVYRSLERMAQNGKVSISDMGLGAAVYELAGEHHHHHLVCQKCGHVLMISDDQVEPFLENIEAEYKYKITTNHLILFGICDYCTENK